MKSKLNMKLELLYIKILNNYFQDISNKKL